MSRLAESLDADLRAQMRARNADTLACIRQLKSKIQEALNAKDFVGALDDALVQRVIASYVKSLEKGIGELAAAGDRSRPLRDRYAAEVAYLQRYLPKALDAAQTRALVDAALAELGVADVKQAGRVLGHLLKAHPGALDPALTRQQIAAALGG